MANRRLIAAAREAAGRGYYGGWRRDLQFSNNMLIVWRNRDDRLTVVLKPGRPGDAWASLRVMQSLTTSTGKDLVGLVDAKVGSWQQALRILAAYSVVPPRHCHYGVQPELLAEEPDDQHSVVAAPNPSGGDS